MSISPRCPRRHRGYLLDKGFAPITVDIIKTVTKQKGQTYYDFIGQIQDSGAICRLAGAVKMADIWHNLHDGLNEGSMKDKYRLAAHILAYGTNAYSVLDL